MTEDQDKLDALSEATDQATSRRLARLRNVPVETAGVERRLMAAIPELRQRGFHGRQGSLWLRLRPLGAVAASLLVMGIVAALLVNWPGGPAVASASDMAQVHYDLVSGKTPVTAVDSVEAASRALAGESQHDASAQAPREHVMACCMRTIKDKRVTCVLMKDQGSPISISVARAADMKVSRAGASVQRGGHTYMVQHSGRLNMVAGQQQGRWVCLIGEVPAERLAEVAAQLKFD